MAFPSIEKLRQLQVSLNTAVEAYVAVVQSSEDSSAEARRDAMNTISFVAGTVYTETRDPFKEVMDLAIRPLINVAARIAIDLNLFELITNDTSIDELAEKCKAEKQMIVRTLRPLVASGIFNQPTERTYSSAPCSRMLMNHSQRDWIKTCYDSLLPAWLQIPTCIRQNSNQDIISRTSNPSILAYGANFFEALSRNPQLERDFASAMATQDNMPADILPQYPFDQDLDTFPKSDPTAVLIVDVGGGNGRFLARIHDSYPTLAEYGKNVLQDLESVINEVPESLQRDNCFIAQAHDFFTPNPVQGARYYNLRSILHDWPDDLCREILLNIRSAMKPGYSKILIQGFVMKEIGYGIHESQLDLNMMIFAGRERTMMDYEELLRGCGLKIGEIVSARKGDWKCIEGLVDESWKDRASRI